MNVQTPGEIVELVKHIPNALSIGRLPAGLALPLLARQNRWDAATTVLLVGAASDLVDGWLARKLSAESQFGQDLDPMSDAALGAGALLGLIVTKQWPLSVVPLVAGVNGSLQLVHNYQNAHPLLKRLKRHQSYVHPLFSVATLALTMRRYVQLSSLSHSQQMVLQSTGAALILYSIWSRRDRALRGFAWK